MRVTARPIEGHFGKLGPPLRFMVGSPNDIDFNFLQFLRFPPGEFELTQCRVNVALWIKIYTKI